MIQSLNRPTLTDVIASKPANAVYKSLNGFILEYLKYQVCAQLVWKKVGSKCQGTDKMVKPIFRYLYEKITMGKELYLSVDRNFGSTLNLILKRHHVLPPLKTELNCFYVKTFCHSPLKSSSDGLTGLSYENK